ncbi:HNH endonuclease [Clostridium sp. 19966]|uniref:HNH endonuclease n=1 Tax=Clostridium sp. 19966 TaxID=2768166 RepID=UPI0028DE2D90|nr:HNH endonuclease [Clostridium sp. 19966]MDT8718995.1 HNH endonuclease [Clostridium sp. 19966]
MLKKLCSYAGCRELVDYADKYCSKHRVIAEELRKQNYREYKARREDKKEQEFYNSKDWIAVRDYVLSFYCGLDLFEWYINNNIVGADTVHHIVEIKDNGGWEHRLDFNNMFPCSKGIHNVIHAAYKRGGKSKQDMQRLLLELCNKFKVEYK